MPVYEVKLRGAKDEEARIVRASSAAKARDHVVEANAINADGLATLVEKGSKIETATETEEPPPAADPPKAE